MPFDVSRLQAEVSRLVQQPGAIRGWPTLAAGRNSSILKAATL
jgi:hypothetical protein